MSGSQKGEMKYFSRPFIFSVLISAIMIFSVLVVSGQSGSQATLQEATQTYDEIGSLANSTTALDIFVNNAQIALGSFIPVVGPAWMIFVQYNSGYAFGNLARYYGLDYVLVLASSVADPIGLLEYSAYILAMAESFVMIHYALQKRARERLLKHTWKTLLAVVGLLAIGAVFEATLIGRPLI